MTSDSEEEAGPRRKSSYQKDENHMLRQEQIQLYKSTVLKEARERRMKLRRGGKLPELPKKKKRVSFERKTKRNEKEDEIGEVFGIERESANKENSDHSDDQDYVESPTQVTPTQETLGKKEKTPSNLSDDKPK